MRTRKAKASAQKTLFEIERFGRVGFGWAGRGWNRDRRDDDWCFGHRRAGDWQSCGSGQIEELSIGKLTVDEFVVRKRRDEGSDL